MSREIAREQGVMLLLGTLGAEERVAVFLLNLSARFSALGYSRSELVLRVTRLEIGSLLGMKFETVSRSFTGPQSKGIIAVDLKIIHILDRDGLAHLHGGNSARACN